MATRTVTVLPLDQVSLEALGGVFAAQREEWRDRLDWDMTDVSGMIESSIESRALPGVALVVEGEAAGYGFYVPEAGRVLIGEIYAIPEARSPRTSDALVEGLLALITASHRRK